MPFPIRPRRSGRPRSSYPHLKEAPTSRRTRQLRHLVSIVVAAAALAAGLLVVFAPPAFAATAGAASLTSVIDNLRNWLVGILASVATLFLTIGGLRYLTAGGDPGQVEKAKIALKSAAVGYALAALAPLLVSILVSLFP